RHSHRHLHPFPTRRSSDLYCDFNKVFLHGHPVDEYVDLLMKEIEITITETPVKQLKTIFVGGGTPTALNEKQLERLCKGIRENLDRKSTRLNSSHVKISYA